MRSSVTLPRAACIDIGSNTTRLLVAELDPDRPGAVVEVAAHRAFVRLTAAERRTGIPEDKARAIAEAVAEQALAARAWEKLPEYRFEPDPAAPAPKRADGPKATVASGEGLVVRYREP
ncbi:MAG: hypothetical protein JWR63_3356, partial [Conexibacter sp.]|nr:hypothetical protein [Conexibacter sp.]